MREQFIQKDFRGESLVLIDLVNEIIGEYQEMGYRLSLRQVYYQLVARNAIANRDSSYKSLGNLVSEARLAGMVDWDAIEDRGRRGVYPTYWRDPRHIVSAAAESFKTFKWNDQPNHVMVMIEKSALEGVVAPVCEKLEVPFHANKGYSSSSALYEVGKELQDRDRAGKELHVIYLGDHDPSGIQMTTDLADRLAMFSHSPVNVMRIALSRKQVDRYQLPPNPTKQTDPRTAAYEAIHGQHCWEVDALNPRVLASMVEQAVLSLRDERIWAESLEREDVMREQLQSIIDGL